MTPVTEVDEKQARLVTVIKDAGLSGVLLATHHNIAWLTGGRSNRIDGSREAGTQRLLVTADGRRLVLANAIEMPRLRNEVLPGLDFGADTHVRLSYATSDALIGEGLARMGAAIRKLR